jgi:hypothetical protein
VICADVPAVGAVLPSRPTRIDHNVRVPRPSRTAVLVATAGLLAEASAWDLTSSPLNLAVALGAVVVLAVTCWRGGPGELARADTRGARVVIAAALLLGAVGAAIRPLVKDVTVTWLFWVGLAVLAVSTVLTWITLRRPGAAANRVGWAGLGAAAVGLAAIVPGSLRPRIDVWVLLQDAAHGFLTGRNPYTLTFPDAPRGQTTECFTYLPGAFLLGAPGRLAGDVRWSELAVLLIGWLALVLAVRRRASGHGDATSQTLPMLTAPVLALATFALVMPATVRVVQQSWTDSLLVGLVLLAVALVIRDHSTWAMLALAVALATKQHVVLLLPLVLIWWGWRRCLAVIAGAALICAPWLLVAPARMWTCGVTFFLELPATHDSISFWRFLPSPARLPVVLALTAAAIWLCWRRLPRTPAGFLLGTAAVNAAFDLANKQSYLNQWWFVAQLILAAVVVAFAAPDRLSGVTTGAVTGTGEPSDGAAAAGSQEVVGVEPPSRRQLLRLIGAGAAAASLAGCSVIRMIGGQGTATGSTPTARPTVLATAVPLLGTADTGTVDAAVQVLVVAAGRLNDLALQRPDLRTRLVAAATAHEAHLHALAGLTGTSVPAHTRLDPTRAPVASGTPSVTPTATGSTAPPTPPTPSAPPNRPTTQSFLASAASIERTLAGAVTTQTTQAVDPDAATLLASVAASATSWQAWFQAASTAARPKAGG